MDVIEMTRQLGAAIQADERYIRFAAAKALNDSDEGLQAQIEAFSALREQMNAELSSETKSEEQVKTLNAEMRQMYALIMANENMVNYNDAKGDLDALVGNINGIITMSLSGDDPLTCEPQSGCGGGCDSCGGCH